MKSNVVVAYIGWLLLIGIFGFYLYGMEEAIRLSWLGDVDKDTYPPALSTAISSIQALLLTNLGVLLGVSVANPTSAVARSMLLQNAVKSGPAAATLAPPTDPLELREKIQLFALGIYIISLIACTIGWAHDDFATDNNKIIDLVSQSGKMLIGVALAYLTAVLRKQTP
jgi:hypothetical protein